MYPTHPPTNTHEGHLEILENTMLVTTRELTQTSGEQRPGTWLSVLQCTIKDPMTKNYLVRNVNSAETGKPWSRQRL